jgi:NAD(P)-dependent dehydrogenase (short-subunit alcohol dehydrogenase family)
MSLLKGQVAIVTGASRGVGKGIALALGERGATVYVTGRSEAGATTEGLAGTIDETAAEVTRRGGRGIAVRCDQTVSTDVESLFARVTAEAGRLDVLVNCAWGGYEQFDWAKFGAPFWEQPPEQWERMFDAGVRAALLASQLAAPSMVAAGRGLIVHVTAWDHDKYLGNLYYDLAKSAMNRMALGMGRELESHGVAVVALAPGFVATERIVGMFAAAGRPAPESAETPEYVGRAVAALAGDAHVLAKTGRVLTVGELAVEYGFTDVDGRQLPPFRMPG